MLIWRYFIFRVFFYTYFLIYFYFLCQQRIYLCPLYHTLIPYDKYDTIEQLYLDNGTTVFVFSPLEVSSPIYQNILFFCNDISGNCSTHYAIVRLFQKLYPTMTLVQMEYSGFGQSYESKLFLHQVQQQAIQSFLFILEDKASLLETYSLLGFKFGAYIASYLLAEKPSTVLDPSHVIFYNPTFSIFDFLDQKIPFPFQAVQITNHWMPTLSTFLEKYGESLNLFLIETDEMVHSLFFLLDHQKHHVRHLYLKGREKFCLLVEKNYSTVQHFLRDKSHVILYQVSRNIF